METTSEHIDNTEIVHPSDKGRIQGEGTWAKLAFFWFILFLSYKCTRRCKYCYAFNQVGDEKETIVEMDEKTFSRLLDWIPEVWKINDIKVNAVSFLGGEPLLRTDRIKRVMDSIYKNTEGMQSDVYTNGDLVDSVNWDDLEDIRWIATNIADNSVEELSRRMKIVGERSNVKGQTITATMDDFNLDRALDITRFGIENGYRLRFYRNLYRGIDTEYKKKLLQKYNEVCDMLEDYTGKGYDVNTTFLFDTLIPSWTYDSSPYLCGKSIAAVFPDGTIGPCLRNHSFKSGTILDEDPLGKINCSTYQFDLEMPDIPEECRSCKSKTACQGGCPFDKLLLTGARSGKSVVCDLHKEIIPRLRHLDDIKRNQKSEI